MSGDITSWPASGCLKHTSEWYSHGEGRNNYIAHARSCRDWYHVNGSTGTIGTGGSDEWAGERRSSLENKSKAQYMCLVIESDAAPPKWRVLTANGVDCESGTDGIHACSGITMQNLQQKYRMSYEDPTG